jgi:Ran GTPase-activating protein (RanGAP) involved in mRNA processing and transport
MVEYMTEVIEHQHIKKLVLRSCQAHPQNLQRLLSLGRHYDTCEDYSMQKERRAVDNQITHLEIYKTSTLDQEVMEIICRCFPHLECLTLNTNNQNLQYLFPLLSNVKSLQILNLNGCQMERNERMVHELAKYLGESSRHQSLRQVSLKCCQLSDQSMHKVVVAMRDLGHMEKLELVGNSCCHEGLNALGLLLESPCAQQLSILDVSYQLGDLRDLKFFSRALQTNGTLKVLRMAGNSMGNDNVQLIAKSLAKNVALHDLDLSANSVGDSGLQALIEAMEQNQVLKTLSLKYNVFADLSCVEYVLRQHNFSLQTLNHSCKPQSENLRRGENGTTISYYLRLNQGGRILLKKDDAPLGLWPIVLEKNFPTKNFDAIFFMLRHSSMLLSSA